MGGKSIFKSNHATCWKAACELEKFTYRQLAETSKCAYNRVTKLVREWESKGAVKAVGTEKNCLQYLVINPQAFDNLIKPSLKTRRQTPEGNMWTAMRGLTTFEPRDIAIHANTDDINVSDDQARAYCRALLRFGYLKVVRKAIPGRREAIYRLIRNTGPRPPKTKRVTGLLDPNDDMFHHGEGKV